MTQTEQPRPAGFDLTDEDGNLVTPSERGEAADNDHRVVSVGGWYCDTCSLPVNGQTDDDGRPLIDGDSVRHTP